MLRFVLVFYTLLHFMCTDTCEITVLLKYFLVKCNAQIAKNKLFMTAIMEFKFFFSAKQFISDLSSYNVILTFSSF